MRISNKITLEYLKLGVYGQPGTGKTTFLASFAQEPAFAPVLFLSIMGNPHVITHSDNITIVEVEFADDLTKLNTIFEWLRQGQPKQHKVATSLSCDQAYKTLIIDCFTDIQRDRFRVVQNLEKANLFDDIAKRTFNDFGKVKEQFQNIAWFLAKLPMHTGISFWESLRGEPEYATVALDGASRDIVPGYLNAVGRLTRNPSFNAKVAGSTFNTLSFKNSATQFGKLQIKCAETITNPTAHHLNSFNS